MGSRSHRQPQGGRVSPPVRRRLDERAPDYCNLLDSLNEAQARLQDAERAIVRLEDAALSIVHAAQEGRTIKGPYDLVSGTAECGLISAEKCRRVLLRLGVHLDQARARRDRLNPEKAHAEDLEHRMSGAASKAFG